MFFLDYLTPVYKLNDKCYFSYDYVYKKWGNMPELLNDYEQLFKPSQIFNTYEELIKNEKNTIVNLIMDFINDFRINCCKELQCNKFYGKHHIVYSINDIVIQFYCENFYIRYIFNFLERTGNMLKTRSRSNNEHQNVYDFYTLQYNIIEEFTQNIINLFNIKQVEQSLFKYTIDNY